MHLGSVALCLVAFYYVVTRLLPQLLSWLLVWRYNLQISLGRIGLHPLCVYQLSLEWGPVRLTANGLTITSSLVNSQVHRPLALCLHGVRLTHTGAASPSPSPSPSSPSSAGRSSASALLSLGQFAGVYVYQAGAEWAVGGERRARLQAARVTLEGTSTIDNGLMLVLRAAALCARLDGAAPPDGEGEVETGDGPPPLARLTAELELQATVQPVSGDEGIRQGGRGR
ncbi:hypothetical protein FJT64_012207 [Amphibalanus amphitrite]|uniref:Uncharacterized protein n=1 Tax=Amphibalanus amphitrite TaxID=1232801 RepID=A0A6A4VE86_AMPAM|nr:hypothetical protein FJT64_012207 [Amphibalanus amphitrite]